MLGTKYCGFGMGTASTRNKGHGSLEEGVSNYVHLKLKALKHDVSPIILFSSNPCLGRTYWRMILTTGMHGN
jgi:hypothetical protein